MSIQIVERRSVPRVMISSSLEAVCLFCSAGIAITAVIAPLLPAEAFVWVLAHLG